MLLINIFSKFCMHNIYTAECIDTNFEHIAMSQQKVMIDWTLTKTNKSTFQSQNHEELQCLYDIKIMDLHLGKHCVKVDSLCKFVSLKVTQMSFFHNLKSWIINCWERCHKIPGLCFYCLRMLPMSCIVWSSFDD